MAEFALLLFPLTVMLLGTIDFCRAFYAYNVINNCARNAAAWASEPNLPYHACYANITAAALADASNLSSSPTVENLSEYTDANGTLNSSAYATDADGNPTTVTVTVSYNFPLLTSYLFGTATIPMSRSVTMRMFPSLPD
jgi:Flp pilus assembly protein TadG